MQNQQTKHWDIYGKVVAIGPYRRYHIRTQSGRVLVQNKHFLRHRSPASCVPLAPSQQNLPANPPNQPTTYAPSQETPVQPPHQQHRSQRPHRAPMHLIEDPSWP